MEGEMISSTNGATCDSPGQRPGLGMFCDRALKGRHNGGSALSGLGICGDAGPRALPWTEVFCPLGAEDVLRSMFHGFDYAPALGNDAELRLRILGLALNHVYGLEGDGEEAMAKYHNRVIDALADNQSAVEPMGTEELRLIASELVKTVRDNAGFVRLIVWRFELRLIVWRFELEVVFNLIFGRPSFVFRLTESE